MVSKDELVEKFVSVTGTDKDTALHMLDACSNNLEFAVMTFLDNGYPQATPTNGTTSPVEDSVRAPIPQTQGVLVEDFEPSPRWNPRRGRSVFDGFTSKYKSKADTSTKGNMKKLKKLEELFRPPYDIMHEGTFQSAREEAVKKNNWLIVNIQNSGEFSCQTLNRDVWSDKKVKNLIKEHFVFWQELNDTRQGEWFLTFYTVSAWPHVSILDPRTGGRLLTLSDPTKESIIESMNVFLADHGSHLDSETASSKSSKEDILHLNEEEQLAVAIAASLRESRVEQNNSNDDVDDSDSDFFSLTAQSVIENNNDSVIGTPALPESTNANNSSPKKKPLKKVFLKPRKRKLSNADEHAPSSPSSKVVKMSTDDVDDDETNKFVLAPEYSFRVKSLANASSALKLTDKPSSSKFHLLLKHPDGHREEVVLPACSKIKDLTSLVSKNYDLSTHELIKNFPRKILSTLHGEFLLEEAGIFPKDTIFIQEKL